jgi:hypothetical protein
MPLAREFKDTVQARLRADRKYRQELLREGVERLLAADLDTGKAILRDYINARIGFEELSRRTKRPAKSLMRSIEPAMGGSPGCPTCKPCRRRWPAGCVSRGIRV